jgi:hypothetical protein
MQVTQNFAQTHKTSKLKYLLPNLKAHLKKCLTKIKSKENNQKFRI